MRPPQARFLDSTYLQTGSEKQMMVPQGEFADGGIPGLAGRWADRYRNTNARK